MSSLIKDGLQCSDCRRIFRTAFYGPIRATQEFYSILVDIDSKLTTLKMVSGETDISGIFERAIVSAEQLGRSVSEILDGITEFSRQGFRGDELNQLADAAAIASNVADMDVKQSADYLTSTLVQWQMMAKDAIDVVNSYNEISNNFGTTSIKLAEGQAKSAATARAMGLDFDKYLSNKNSFNCWKLLRAN